MGRVNKPILILNIIVFAVALSLILYAVIAQTCAGILILLPLGLLLLICQITGIITTLIGKSKLGFYVKDEAMLSEQDKMVIYRKDESNEIEK